MKNQIRSIDPGSPAERCGIRTGDVLLAINGKQVQDVLDYKYYGYDARLHLALQRDGRPLSVTVKKREGEDIGLNFDTYLMDRARSCANRCIFCFVDQMPPGMRKTLYFKDDDARLSFLMGNYITMTNLSEREIERICSLHLSPINISVHAADPEVRVRMLRNPRAAECITTMKRFAEAGITMNCQIVACPGINDGEVLVDTMRQLSALYPAVRSVSIVPVGLTRYREGLYPLEPYTPARAGDTLNTVEQFQAQCLKEHESRIFWCSDEFYLMTGRPIPPEPFYEGFVQLENGVGMLRLLYEEAVFAGEDYSDSTIPEPFSVACGTAVRDFMDRLLREVLNGQNPALRGVYAISNRFFGESINVSGLITGSDLIEQLKGKDLGSRLLISSNMLRHGENVFLDDVTVTAVEESLGVKVVSVPQDGAELVQCIFENSTEKTGGDSASEAADSGDCDEFYRYNPPGRD